MKQAKQLLRHDTESPDQSAHLIGSYSKAQGQLATAELTQEIPFLGVSFNFVAELNCVCFKGEKRISGFLGSLYV